MTAKGVLTIGFALIVISAASCMKLDKSPLQNLGPILVLTTQESPTRYRFTFTGLRTSQMGLYVTGRAPCSSLIARTQQTVNAGQMTEYVSIEPGSYGFGNVPIPQCVPFTAERGNSYTLSDDGAGTLSVASP